jgi:lipoprotein-anchoring transpeptidase ErfK/SrfK
MLGSIKLGRNAPTAVLIAIAILLLGAVTAYAVDASKRGRIAPGVRVAGVDLGGMNERQAERALDADVARPLVKPVTIVFDKRRFRLQPRGIGLHADVDGMVDEAFDASNNGGIMNRLWRYATDGEVSVDLPPRVTYSRARLGGFIAGLKNQINRPPQDARVEPSPSSIDPVPARDGIELRLPELRSRIQSALQAPSLGHRVVRARAVRTKPEVTLAELAPKYPHYITINRAAFQLRYYRNLELVKTYPIAVGMVGLETPAGLYHIQNKGINVAWQVPNSDWAGDLAGKTIPGGAPDNPLKARWMGIYAGAGIHGTDQTASLGSAASHGCIRMAIPDVIELYGRVPLGAPVYIG